MSSASSAPAERGLSAADLALMAQTRALLGAYVVGDTDGVLPRCTPTCTFAIPGDPRVLPWARRYVGADFRRFHSAIKDNVDVIDYVAPWMELWGDRSVLLMRERARLRGSGGLFSQHLLGVFTFADGLLTAYDEDSDPWAMEEAVRGRAAAPPDDPAPPWITEAGGWGGVVTRGSAAVRADGDSAQTADLLRAVARAEVEGERSALRSAAHLGLTVWVGGADPRLPWAGTATGLGALASASGERGWAWRRELVDLNVEAYGGSGLLRIRERITARVGGPAVEVQRAVLGAARDGLISRWWEWADTAALARVCAAGG